MVYCLVLFTYLFFDYNFLLLNFSNSLSFFLVIFNVFSIFYCIVSSFNIPLNIFIYIFFNDNFQLYNSLFLYSISYFNLLTFSLTLVLFLYLTVLFYVNTYLLLVQFIDFFLFKINSLFYNYKKLSFFCFFEFPPQTNFYNPFFFNNYRFYKSNSINISFNLLKSFIFYFKNRLFLNLNVFALFLFNTTIRLYFYLRKPLWKPLSKKTSYFGLYSSFKNKY